jgi:hypothetical protein
MSTLAPAIATPACLAPRAPLARRAPARPRSRPPRAAAAPGAPPPKPAADPEPAALAARLAAAEAALAEERDRVRFLAPYRVAAPRRGVVGASSYAKALRRAVVDAARDPACAPVLIFGEPGLEKDNIAALVHFGSARGKAPLLAVDCSRLDDDAAELFGRGARRGLLARAPPDATVVLVDAHLAPPGAWPEINAAVAAAAAAGACGLAPRLILVSERPLPELAAGARVVKVPPLRVRREDVADLAELFLRDFSKRRGGGRVALTPAARRRLEAGAWPGNVAELRAAVERAALQAEPVVNVGAGTTPPPPLEVSDDLVWFAPAERGPTRGLARLDLLRALPALRRFLRSPLWPDQLNFQFTVYAFAAIVAVLFLGPQDREHNAALLAFWDLWWPLSFFAFPFLGRIWCSVCPFMIMGELAQKGAAAAGWPLRRWPRAALDAWGAWFLFALFAGILVWEEAWDLPQHAALSSWLLLLITAGATLGSVFYERRVW